jgi:hypothetical protein
MRLASPTSSTRVRAWPDIITKSFSASFYATLSPRLYTSATGEIPAR